MKKNNDCIEIAEDTRERNKDEVLREIFEETQELFMEHLVEYPCKLFDKFKKKLEGEY